MARLICEEGLQKELIEAFDNPATFAELYNEISGEVRNICYPKKW